MQPQHASGEISGFHTVEIYNGKNKPHADHRLCVTTFKSQSKFTDKDSPEFDPNYKRPDARCVSIPAVKITATPVLLQDALQQAFEDMQDAVIRDIIVAAIEEDKKLIQIHDDQVSFEAVAKFAAENAASGKLTKDGIEGWFDEELADVLTLKLANTMKLPDNATPEQNKKLADAVTSYKTVFLTLAAPKAGISPKIAKQLKSVVELCENKENRMFKVLHGKITAHLEQKEPELIGL